VHIEYGGASITGSTFLDNSVAAVNNNPSDSATALAQGGAISILGGWIDVTESEFTGNTATSTASSGTSGASSQAMGGAVFFDTGLGSFTNVSFDANEAHATTTSSADTGAAYASGAAIASGYNSSIVILGSTFVDHVGTSSVSDTQSYQYSYAQGTVYGSNNTVVDPVIVSDSTFANATLTATSNGGATQTYATAEGGAVFADNVGIQ